MAGNSVPVFFGAKARSEKPPAVDVTSITDLSGSMQPYASFISSRSTIVALENALVAQGIGVLSTNRYSFTTGADIVNNTLSEIELNVTVNGVSQRWAPGSNVLDGSAELPSLVAQGVGKPGEDMGLASNLVTGSNRDYLTGNERIIIAGSDEQSEFTAFTVGPPYPHRYVGVHSVELSLSEPAGPNPVPAGDLIGFVYTTDTTGAAIYDDSDNQALNYRLAVPVANMTATGIDGTEQINVDHARTTNGAIYKIDIDFNLLGESLGNVLGQYLFEIS